MKYRIILHAAVATALTMGLVAKIAQAEVYSSGTGFIINELGHLMTNNHVVTYGVKDKASGRTYVRLCSRLEISGGDYEGDAEIIGRDKKNDLADLKLVANKRVAGGNQTSRPTPPSKDGKWRSLGKEMAPGSAPGSANESVKLSAGNSASAVGSGGGRGSFARFSDAKLRPGEQVVVVGYPYSFILSAQPKVSTGVLSSTAGYGHDVARLQHTAPSNPGNSGGPLMNASGNVMAVHVAGLKLESQGVKFAIKANIARALLDTLNVPYHTAPRGQELRTEDIMSRATRFTVLILCHV